MNTPMQPVAEETENAQSKTNIKGEADQPSPFLRSALGMSTPPVFHLNTLKIRRLFQEASGGPRFSTPAFTMLRRLPRADDHAEMAGIRFGFTVTKKIGNAVVRNRIRRRLREAVRAASGLFPAGPFLPAGPLDLVFLARQEALRVNFQSLVADIARAVETLSRRDKAPPPREKRIAGSKNGSKQLKSIKT